MEGTGAIVKMFNRQLDSILTAESLQDLFHKFEEIGKIMSIHH
jgi:hypothetical protein